jgi:ribosomal protein S18 acetylase RimI-like enzyme
MKIRVLIPEDAGAFQALRLSALCECPSAFASSYGEECDLPISTIAERISPAPCQCLFGAFDQSTLVGCIGVQRATELKRAHKAFIWGMYVSPSHRNRGVARELLTRALEFAGSMRGLRTVTLSVTQGNASAVTLYEQMGFRVFGIEPDAMLIDQKFHDEIHMVLSIRRET